MDRDTELAMIAAFPDVKLCPTAFAAPTLQANLSAVEIQRRIAKVPRPVMSKTWRRLTWVRI
jgi:hypothetical protein